MSYIGDAQKFSKNFDYQKLCELELKGGEGEYNIKTAGLLNSRGS